LPLNCPWHRVRPALMAPVKRLVTDDPTELMLKVPGKQLTRFVKSKFGQVFDWNYVVFENLEQVWSPPHSDPR
jgi:hypothetical protein